MNMKQLHITKHCETRFTKAEDEPTHHQGRGKIRNYFSNILYFSNFQVYGLSSHLPPSVMRQTA